jgi:hypothetical protein
VIAGPQADPNLHVVDQEHETSAGNAILAPEERPAAVDRLFDRPREQHSQKAAIPQQRGERVALLLRELEQGASGLGFTLAGQPSDAETFRAKFAQWDIYESTGAKPFGAGPNARGKRYRELFVARVRKAKN